MSIKANGFFQNKEINNSPFLFLEKGTTHLRVLPAYSEKGAFYREIKEIPWHNDEGKYKPVVSPATIGKPCPFVEEGKRLYTLGGEENIQKAQDLRPRSSFLFNVVVKSTPSGDTTVDDCVKVLKCGISVYRGIMDLEQDAAGGWGDITNIEKGIDIRITRTGMGRTDTKYTVKGFPGGRTNILEWLEEKGYKQELVPQDLDEFFVPQTYEELLPLLKQKLEKRAENTENIDNDEKAPLAPIISENIEAAPALPEVN